MCSDFVVGFITLFTRLAYVLQEVQQIPQHKALFCQVNRIGL